MLADVASWPHYATPFVAPETNKALNRHKLWKRTHGESENDLLIKTNNVYPPRVYTIPSINQERKDIVVTVPIAELSNSFVVHAARRYDEELYETDSDTKLLPIGREAETRITILRLGYYRVPNTHGDQAVYWPVTQVLLRPITGRRHQLRLHCRLLGFPIVGDRSYGGDLESFQAHRMMLHAHTLRYPPPPLLLCVSHHG